MRLSRPEPLRKQVYDYLRELMISGRLSAGDYLNQAELMARLGVSRTPLRDSLMQLEAEGFVSIIPCKGVRINPLTREALRKIYQISGALEAAAFESVFAAMDEALLSELHALVDRTEAAMDRGDFSGCLDNNTVFHERILERCDNEDLLKVLRCNRERLFRFPGRETRTLSSMPEGFASWERGYWRQHRRILELFRTGPARELADYIRYVHWDFEGSRDRIASFYGLEEET